MEILSQAQIDALQEEYRKQKAEAEKKGESFDISAKPRYICAHCKCQTTFDFGDKPTAPMVLIANPKNGRECKHWYISEAFLRAQKANCSPQSTGGHFV